MSKKRFKNKVNIKKGDNVVVIAGEYKDRTTTREVTSVDTVKGWVTVEGVNIRKKHLKPTQDNRGGIVEINGPIHISNVMLVDPKSGEPTRVGRRKDDNGKIVRYAKASGEMIK